MCIASNSSIVIGVHPFPVLPDSHLPHLLRPDAFRAPTVTDRAGSPLVSFSFSVWRATSDNKLSDGRKEVIPHGQRCIYTRPPSPVCVSLAKAKDMCRTPSQSQTASFPSIRPRCSSSLRPKISEPTSRHACVVALTEIEPPSLPRRPNVLYLSLPTLSSRRGSSRA